MMRKDTGLLIISGIIIVILVLILVFGKNPKKESIRISDFESCAKAGNTILQTNPSICKTSDGKIFNR